ncbi:AraC family transcriptional regulator [Paenibacillus sp. BK033]|uniref:AraC family transcriptional regulator n=1 Tax=Paenibacillus sp. BK033 TaxID=2512133 RepID=UPI0010513D45|nr:AraC family transcriptional regulator [Paenibacillus sp. BK033]TCM96579.1 AraC family transcriptional regulator [Paenibacillus sp. BK033]
MDNYQENVQEVLNRILNVILKLPLRTNRFQTVIPFLQILTEKSPTVASKGPLKPSLCIIVQGKTHMQIGEETIEYKPGNFLATSVNLPVTGQVVEASVDTPYMALRIELPPGEVAAVATEADLKLQPRSESHQGIFVGKTTLEVAEGFEKLIKLLQNPKAAKYLAPAVKREIIFWLLAGEEGAAFYFSMLWHQEASEISKVVDWVTHNFNSNINIKELAKLGNMSVSSLHYKFKEVTGKTPLQYQKQLRLQEARRLLLDGANVTETALQMGYQSSTQFSREYKRLFGLSPVHYLRSRNDALSNQI